MRGASCVLCLFFAAGLRACVALISDEECLATGAQRVMGKVSQSHPKDFKGELESYGRRPFLTAVRYCLGPDAGASSQDFISCLLSLSTCPRGGMEIVNWELCACDTAYCILMECGQRWLEARSLSDFSCVKPCLEQNSSCIVRQTGSLGRPAWPLSPKATSTVS
ncbi:signal peptide containing protein [Babesia caballi]|uniref:Signal peptide containing protein n=1 Tax=Babesia caballi TaxID=5871 RepID=A0AAV4M0K8_BABCB|nr:signal peptide containing protein [Babesia caballi]GIX65427.1 signal peptide containing protein [Babesia caballi]